MVTRYDVISSKWSSHVFSTSFYNKNKSTWSYENWVTKHSVIFSQLPLSNRLSTLLFAYVLCFCLFCG